MGTPSSVYFKCPHCEELQEEQFKPGRMASYYFPDDMKRIPIAYLQRFQKTTWTCTHCDKEFRTDVNIFVQVDNACIYKET